MTNLGIYSSSGKLPMPNENSLLQTERKDWFFRFRLYLCFVLFQ